MSISPERKCKLMQCGTQREYGARIVKELVDEGCYFSQRYYVPAGGFGREAEQGWMQGVVACLGKSKKMSKAPKLFRAKDRHSWILRFRQSRVVISRYGDASYVVLFSRDVTRWVRFFILKRFYEMSHVTKPAIQKCGSEDELRTISKLWKQFVDSGRSRGFFTFARRQDEWKSLSVKMARRWKRCKGKLASMT
jgi:hypothetical protein